MSKDCGLQVGEGASGKGHCLFHLEVNRQDGQAKKRVAAEFQPVLPPWPCPHGPQLLLSSECFPVLLTANKVPLLLLGIISAKVVVVRKEKYSALPAGEGCSVDISPPVEKRALTNVGAHSGFLQGRHRSFPQRADRSGGFGPHQRTQFG